MFDAWPTLEKKPDVDVADGDITDAAPSRLSKGQTARPNAYQPPPCWYHPERPFRGRSGSKSVEVRMAKQKAEAVYKIVEVVGVSDKSWEDAGRNAVAAAAGSLRDLRVAEVTKMDMKVEGGKIVAFRTRVSLSFKYEA
jgi:flavin-binding protein dodecin